MENTKPDYYKLQIKEVYFDVFDLVRAIRAKVPNFSFELCSALKYIVRIKMIDIDKRINDLEKATECINREIQHLKELKIEMQIVAQKQQLNP
jgi:hypothetical protein